MENSPTTKKSFSLDWLVRGTLTKLGEMFDQFTGRNWKPSSNLATSELIERLKILLDSEVKDSGEKGKFVPHNIKLLMQWDKFSTDAEDSLKKLENELLTAAIDHINDRRYHTYAPLKFEIKPDYFTEGIKLLASFDEFAEQTGHEAALNVTVPDLKNVILDAPAKFEIKPEKEIFTASFTVKGNPRQVKLSLAEKERLSVGRTKENDLWLDDAGVSKIHAALVLNAEKQLMVADTGSTNGTFVNENRIAYGRATVINDGETVKFGTVAVSFERLAKENPEEVAAEDFKTDKSFSGNENYEPNAQKLNIDLSEK